MEKSYRKILIAQTAFIGDVILATGLIESLRKTFPHSQIDFLLRKGNEGLLKNHPHLQNLLIWDKKRGKTKNLIKLIGEIRKEKYDLLINLQRFASSGILTVLSGAKETRGFSKNPLSAFFTKRFAHNISPESANPPHETERNFSIIADIKGVQFADMRLYPTSEDYLKIKRFTQSLFICVAPASVWYTKQLHIDKWVEMLDNTSFEGKVYLLGAPSDLVLCEEIKSKSTHKNIEVLAGKLNLLQSAALMENAQASFVNDSAPMHISSAMDAPTCAVFCSTIPGFGFGPRASKNTVIEVNEPLDCRPCGLHGRSACPKGHFNCAVKIENKQFEEALKYLTS